MFKALKQSVIEDKFSKREISHKIREDLLSTPKIAEILDNIKSSIRDYCSKRNTYWASKNIRVYTLIHENDIDDVATDLALAAFKSGTIQVKIHGAVTSLARSLNGYSDYMDAVRTASELLGVCCDCGLYDLFAARSADEGVLSIRCLYRLEDKTEQFIANTMYRPPMICQPKIVEGNFDSNYLNPISESVVLKKHNYHNEPLALDAINIASQIPLSLDLNMLEYKEEPNKELPNVDAVKQFNLMKQASEKVYDMLLDNDNLFYLGWRFDSRGRMYSQGYHVNIQSTDFKKSILNFHEPELIEVCDV